MLGIAILFLSVWGSDWQINTLVSGSLFLLHRHSVWECVPWWAASSSKCTGDRTASSSLWSRVINYLLTLLLWCYRNLWATPPFTSVSSEVFSKWEMQIYQFLKCLCSSYVKKKIVLFSDNPVPVGWQGAAKTAEEWSERLERDMVLSRC